MKSITRLLIVAIVLATSITAQADIVMWNQGSVYEVHITDPVAVGAAPGGENLIGFMVKIVNISGNPLKNPAGFNGLTPQETTDDSAAWPTMPTYLGFYSPNGAMFHNQYDDYRDAGTSPVDDDPDFITELDTHFNFELGDVIPTGTGPTEVNKIVAGTSEPLNATGPYAGDADNDFGNRLYGLFAVNGGVAADVDDDHDPSVWELAYLVVPHDALLTEQIYMDFFVTGTNPGDVIQAFIVVPEPATMSLLAIGGIGALIRRRKK
jgi:hypothetical protein